MTTKSDLKILFVDDDQEMLNSIQRVFRPKYNIDLSLDGQKGLKILSSSGPFAVVVSDYRMPIMNGIEFLTRAREICPDSVRIMLTGLAEFGTAIKAVNEGQVFRFLTKPCSNDHLEQAVKDGLEYFQMVRDQKELYALKRWRKSTEEIILAFARLIETRDPYTAGHQQRVADLSSAIAKEMGFPPEQVEAVKMAATIHDIGKIYVPAEILNRPGRLSEIEMSMIKLHPQAGYDILKNVGFEYPIHEIIYQHHERMNGSGYPQGLKEGDILVESCIIAVADTVEAMFSHRPYRPGLGLDKALHEIEKNTGILYSPEPARTCLRLFKENGFAFQDSL